MVGFNNDPYEELGVTHGASLIEIRKAYRKMALRYHPDRLDVNRCTLEELRYATGKFAEISAAYNVLNNPEAKRRFDYNYRYGAYDHHQTACSSGSRTTTAASSSANQQNCSSSSSNRPHNHPSHNNSDDSSAQPHHHQQQQQKRQQQQQQQQQQKHYSRGRWDDTRRGEDGYNYDRNYTYPRGAAPVIFKFKGCPSSDIFWFNPIKLLVSYFQGKKFQTNTFTGETPDGSRQYVKKTTHIHKDKQGERLFTTTRIETTTIHKDGTRHVTIQQTGNPNVHSETTHISSSSTTNTTTTNHKQNHHTFKNNKHNNNSNNTKPRSPHISNQKQSNKQKSTEKLPWYESIWEQIINNNCLESSACGQNQSYTKQHLHQQNCDNEENQKQKDYHDNMITNDIKISRKSVDTINR